MAYKKVEMTPAHDFEVQKSVEGVYVGKKTGIGENKSTIYNLRQADGTTIGVGGSTVLDTKMGNVAEGQQVKIMYLGKVKSNTRKGSSYKDFAVFVDDGEEADEPDEAKEDEPPF
jgi:hypothetical protein